MRFGELCEETDDKAPKEIDHECAVREVNTPAGRLGPCAECVTKDGAKCSAQGNKDNGLDRRHENFSYKESGIGWK